VLLKTRSVGLVLSSRRYGIWLRDSRAHSDVAQIYTINGPATEVEAKAKFCFVSSNEKGKVASGGVGKHASASAQTQTGTAAAAAEQQGTTSKQRSDNLRGCDWLQEVSVTVRKFQSTSVACER